MLARQPPFCLREVVFTMGEVDLLEHQGIDTQLTGQSLGLIELVFILTHDYELPFDIRFVGA